MNPTRRQFLTSATIGGAAASVLGFDLTPAYAEVRELKIARTTETRSTCPYCSVSCGVILHTLGDKSRNVKPRIVHVEGDPDHPINQGTLCPKGITLKQNIVNDRRLHRYQRAELSPREGFPRRPRRGADRAAGPDMTRADGGQSGRHVRARSDDQRLDRHPQRGRRAGDGRQSG